MTEPFRSGRAMEDERHALKARIGELKTEHRDLDDVITTMAERAHVDQLQLRRLKKRKLLLKDLISRMESELIPDLDA